MKNFTDYQQAIQQTRNFKSTELSNYALGLVCEAGEAGDLLKKHLFHDHELNREQLIAELGDVMWYLGNICNVCEIDLAEVAQANIDKLARRYPDGFSEQASQNRAQNE